MKKIILSVVAGLAVSFSFGQITLEHTYGDNAAPVQLFHTKLSTGYKYWTLQQDDNSDERTLKVYNLDHSLYKEINFQSYTYFKVGYVSDKLFDTDTGLEFMYYANGGDSTAIIDEDGSVIFSANQTAYRVDDYIADQASLDPVIATPNGTKMILKDNYKGYVYSLPGSLPTALVTPNQDKYNINLYPNPSSDYIKINYSLPPDVKIAQVDVYDMNGKVVKTYKVDNTFNDILIDTNALSSGSYVCRIYSKSQVLSETKFVVTK